MSFCNRVRRTVKPPATPVVETSPFMEGTPTGRGFDIYLVKREDYEAAETEYQSKHARAWAWKNSKNAIFKEECWPRKARAVGNISTTHMPYVFSTAIQEGIYLHEVLGHAILGLDHDSDHPTMNQSEKLPKKKRLELMLEIPNYYSYIRVQFWNPAIVHADD